MIPLALAIAIPEIIKGIIGGTQLLQSKKYSETERPEYEIPESQKQALESAKIQSLQTQLPGQSLAEEKLAATTAQGVSAAKEATDSSSNILGIIAQLNQQQSSGIQNLAGMAAENYNTNQGILRTALGQMAVEEGNKWQWDKAQPYLSAMDTAANLQESGEKNIVNSLESIANIGLTSKYMDLLGGGDASGAKLQGSVSSNASKSPLTVDQTNILRQMLGQTGSGSFGGAQTGFNMPTNWGNYFLQDTPQTINTPSSQGFGGKTSGWGGFDINELFKPNLLGIH